MLLIIMVNDGWLSSGNYKIFRHNFWLDWKLILDASVEHLGTFGGQWNGLLDWPNPE